jgi:hypothetical protein
MGSPFIIITFDLNGAKSQDYVFIRKELEKVDFSKFVISKKTSREVGLPNNTFTCKFEQADDFSESKSTEIVDHFATQLKSIFKKCDVKGKYFIFVGKQWAWKTNPTHS